MNFSMNETTDRRYTRALKRHGITENTGKNQAQSTNEKKSKSIYETIFSDVVTPCYVRGYN